MLTYASARGAVNSYSRLFYKTAFALSKSSAPNTTLVRARAGSSRDAVYFVFPFDDALSFVVVACYESSNFHGCFHVCVCFRNYLCARAAEEKYRIMW